MSKHVFMSRRSMDSDIADSGLGFVTPPKMTFEATADFDGKVYALVAKDSIMLKEMNEAITSFYDDDVCAAIKAKMRVFDKLIQGMFDKNADLGTINKQLKGLNDALERDKGTYEKASQIVIDKVWQKYQKKQEAYKKYKVDISISVALSAVTIGASFIGGVSSAPFTGGSSGVLAIIGIAQAGRSRRQGLREFQEARQGSGGARQARQDARRAARPRREIPPPGPLARPRRLRLQRRAQGRPGEVEGRRRRLHAAVGDGGRRAPGQGPEGHLPRREIGATGAVYITAPSDHGTNSFCP